MTGCKRTRLRSAAIGTMHLIVAAEKEEKLAHQEELRRAAPIENRIEIESVIHVRNASLLAYVFLLCLGNFSLSMAEVPEGWMLPIDTLFATKWYKQDHSQYLKATGDYDGNGLVDTALILESVSGDNFALMVFMQYGKDSSSKVVLLDAKDEAREEPRINNFKNHVSRYKCFYGVATVPKGTHKTACGKGYWDCAPDEMPELSLRTEAVSLFRVEAGGTRYYFWDKTKKRFQFAWMND